MLWDLCASVRVTKNKNHFLSTIINTPGWSFILHSTPSPFAQHTHSLCTAHPLPLHSTTSPLLNSTPRHFAQHTQSPIEQHSPSLCTAHPVPLHSTPSPLLNSISRPFAQHTQSLCTTHPVPYWTARPVPLHSTPSALLKSCQGVMVTTRQHLASRLRTSGAILLHPLYETIAWTRKIFILLQYIRIQSHRLQTTEKCLM